MAWSGVTVECHYIVLTWKRKMGALGGKHGEDFNIEYVGIVRPCLWANLGSPGQPAGSISGFSGCCFWEIAALIYRQGTLQRGLATASDPLSKARASTGEPCQQGHCRWKDTEKPTKMPLGRRQMWDLPQILCTKHNTGRCGVHTCHPRRSRSSEAM